MQKLTDAIKSTVEKYASEFELDPRVVFAVIEQESSNDRWAVRYEPKWPLAWMVDPKTYAKKNGISIVTERKMQQCSWGLMQVMGAVLRELGYEGPLTKGCSATISIKYGCKKLSQLDKKYKGNLQNTLAAYNAGNARSKQGQSYAKKVMARMA